EETRTSDGNKIRLGKVILDILRQGDHADNNLALADARYVMHYEGTRAHLYIPDSQKTAGFIEPGEVPFLERAAWQRKWRPDYTGYAIPKEGYADTQLFKWVTEGLTNTTVEGAKAYKAYSTDPDTPD